LVAVAAALARLPLLGRPLNPDEGGFLMVAGQWAPGTSLYGDYWVDRPPLLITIFQAVDALGGRPLELRMAGIVAVVIAVLAAAAIGRGVVRLECQRGDIVARVPTYAATAAAVLLASPVLGATEVDGELLAAPLVLGGLAALLVAQSTSGRRAGVWWGAAGALGAAAVAIKQNMLDVFVAAAVLLVVAGARRAPGLARSIRSFALGAAGCVLVLLVWAARHGTHPTALWNALVTFRIEATTVIAQSASSSTGSRALLIVLALLLSGELLLVAAVLAPSAPRHLTRHLGLVGWMGVAVLAWETLGVMAGGSYWLHYLVGTVPGLVLLTAVAARGGRRRRLAIGAVLAWVAVVAAAAVGVIALQPGFSTATTVGVEEYLSQHKRPGDTGVVAFGQPQLLQAAQLTSPYPQLWSLPVRVTDPALTQFAAVLAGPDRPSWVVVDGGSLTTWGVDATAAQPILERDYRLVHVIGDWHIYQVRVGTSGMPQPFSDDPSA